MHPVTLVYRVYFAHSSKVGHSAVYMILGLHCFITLQHVSVASRLVL